MKNIGIILAMAAALFTFAGCASKSATDTTMTETPAHHDVKGEVSK